MGQIVQKYVDRTQYVHMRHTPYLQVGPRFVDLLHPYHKDCYPILYYTTHATVC